MYLTLLTTCNSSPPIGRERAARTLVLFLMLLVLMTASIALQAAMLLLTLVGSLFVIGVIRIPPRTRENTSSGEATAEIGRIVKIGFAAHVPIWFLSVGLSTYCLAQTIGDYAAFSDSLFVGRLFLATVYAVDGYAVFALLFAFRCFVVSGWRLASDLWTRKQGMGVSAALGMGFLATASSLCLGIWGFDHTISLLDATIGEDFRYSLLVAGERVGVKVDGLSERNGEDAALSMAIRLSSVTRICKDGRSDCLVIPLDAERVYAVPATREVSEYGISPPHYRLSQGRVAKCVT
jgi:hypothetical protein